ncbi:hypothetical protein M3J07_011723 [Ascochyta lentis]
MLVVCVCVCVCVLYHHACMHVWWTSPVHIPTRCNTTRGFVGSRLTCVLLRQTNMNNSPHS